MKKLNAKLISNLSAGQHVTSEGLEVRHLKGGIAYYANTMVHGRRLRRKLGEENAGFNLARARKALIQLKAVIDPDELDRLSVRAKRKQTFEEASAYYLVQLSKTDGNNLHQKAQQLRDHLIPYFGSTAVDQITTLQIEHYKSARLGANAAKGTVNTELAVIKHVYSKLIEWGVCKTRPFVCRTIQNDNARIEVFTKDESDRLLEAASGDSDPFTYLFVLIGLNTGMRHLEIASLHFKHIDFEKRRIFLPDAKTGARTQPFPEALLKPLKYHQSMLDDPYGWVFPSKSKTGHRGCMKSQFKRIVTAIGLDAKRYTPHVMRHTAITRLIEQGTPIATVQKVSGHKSIHMLMRYTHISDQVVDDALDAAFVG